MPLPRLTTRPGAADYSHTRHDKTKHKSCLHKSCLHTPATPLSCTISCPPHKHHHVPHHPQSACQTCQQRHPTHVPAAAAIRSLCVAAVCRPAQGRDTPTTAPLARPLPTLTTSTTQPHIRRCCRPRTTPTKEQRHMKSESAAAPHITPHHQVSTKPAHALQGGLSAANTQNCLMHIICYSVHQKRQEGKQASRCHATRYTLGAFTASGSHKTVKHSITYSLSYCIHDITPYIHITPSGLGSGVL